MFVNFSMHRFLLSILLTTSLFAREYIAIIDFEGINVSEGDAKALTQRLTSELIKLETYQVLERNEMKRLLEENELRKKMSPGLVEGHVHEYYTNCIDLNCAVEIGKIIGAKYMVMGTISKLGKTFTLDSRLISVESSEAYGSGQYSTDVSIDNLIKYGMKSLAYQLCDLEPPKISPITKLTDILYSNRYIIGGVSLVVWMAWGMNWITF